MRVLVTGAAGFLGRALVQWLQPRADTELHTTDARPAAAGIFHACDLLDCAAVARLMEEIVPDRVYHLAGTFTNEYGPDFKGNVDSTRHLLESVRRSGRPARLLLIGSAAEYGCVRPDENPVREDYALAPVSVYGWTKACQTLLMQYYYQVHGLDVVMARLFNLSGVGASERLFVGRLQKQIEQFLSGAIKEIIVGNLDSVRDYLPVTEAARGLERVMRFGDRGEVYHVAGGVPTRMRDLLEELLQAQGVPRACVREASRQADDKLDVPVIYADISKTNRLPVLG